MIVKALQLLLHIVQLQKCPERLGVDGAVHGWRVKLEDSVILAQCVLDKLGETSRSEKLKKANPAFCISSTLFILNNKLQYLVQIF